MLKPAANLSMLFQEIPFAERFQAAHKNGFTGVEFLYQPDVAPSELLRLLADSDLKHVLANMEGSPTDKGLAAVAGRENDFRDRFERSLAAAVETKALMLHVTAGVIDDKNLSGAADVFYKNMAWAGNLAATADVALVIEAINQRDVPSFFLRSLDDAIRWCQTLWADNVYLILDFYHAGIEGLKIQDVVEIASPWTQHIQIASVPHRNEPVLDDDTVGALLALKKAGYGGWLGCEYRPGGLTEDGLGWLEKLRKWN